MLVSNIASCITFPLDTGVCIYGLESQEVCEAREYYHLSKDVSGTLKRMPKWMNMERQLLQGLERHGEKRNFLGALNFVSKKAYLVTCVSFRWCVVLASQ